MKNKEKNVEEIDNFEVFTAKIFNKVPTNCVMVRRNRLTGKISVVGYESVEKTVNGKKVKSWKFEQKGIVINMPWIESRFVSMAVRTIDYPARQYEASGNVDVVVDAAISVKVVDPEKYLFAHQDGPEAELKIMIERVLRTIIRNDTYENLAQTSDLYKQINTKVGSPAMQYAQTSLASFASQYGLMVTGISIQKIDQTPEMKAAFEAQKKAQLEQEARITEAETRRRVAIADAETAEIAAKGEAAAKKVILEVISEALKNSDPAQAQAIYAAILGDKANASIIADLAGNGLGATGAVIGAVNGSSKKKV